MATAHVLVRVWLPDRPGALGQVASRIGSVRGDIVGVDVLECDGGVAIDEFAVNLADPELVPMLVREIEEVDGASVEEVRVVNHFPDPRLDALESATRLCQVTSVKELHEALVEQVRKEFLAEWAALIVGIGPEEEHIGGNGADRGTAAVAATAGEAPGGIRMEQNFGPHIEQKWAVLAPSAGRVSSWYDRAVSGSSDSSNWSAQRKSKRALERASSQAWAPGWPLARSAAWAAIL